ncbi:hypothetical protein BC351_01235 [Paenibacillus ferrarius]|uniref:Uncharacterized protein n=1 Tax=Paenibacillus ferrarius TaxID=1469647 RepID=A0A1V4HSH2_9BACL|nr:hypothetical protein [Paenibacillus ferrarius]OPH61894.1 hypothetical protein BC351_01235 [Paenibacillus ferrarius]
MNQTIHKVYKIRDKETGLFSRGGTRAYDIWTKEGKSWSTIGHLKSHLTQFTTSWNKVKYPYGNAEIIEVEINYDLSYKVNVATFLEAINAKHKKADEDYESIIVKWKEEAERKQLEELKKKYE